MKRLVALVVMFLVFQIVAFASVDIDLDSLSEYELFELQMEVQEKLYEYDPSAGFIMYPGVSIVGKNFEAGSYVVKVVEPIENEYDFPPYITIWKNEDVIGSIMREDFVDDPSFREKDDVYQCNLIDGMCFELNYGVFQFIKRK